MANNNKQIHFEFNAPAVLVFTALCLVSVITDHFTGGKANALVFSVYRSSLTDPMTYLRFFTHVFGHSGWDHLLGNITVILLIGPSLEDRYGSKKMILLMLLTALLTGLVHFILFPGVALMGASGVAFAMILLLAFTSFKGKAIPITFILVVILYLGSEIWNAVFVEDNISNLTHILGGIVGIVFGLIEKKAGHKSK